MKDLPLRVACYWILHDIKTAPRCSNCGKELGPDSFMNMKAGYHLNCSMMCARQSAHAREKYKSTCQAKYGKGITNVSQVAEVKQKKIESSLRKYNTENVAQAEEVKQKTRATCLKKYDATSSIGSKAMHKKSEDTCVKRYGVKSYS